MENVSQFFFTQIVTGLHYKDNMYTHYTYIFNSIYYRNTAGINTVLNLRSNKQYVPIIFPALIISLKLFKRKMYKRLNR